LINVYRIVLGVCFYFITASSTASAMTMVEFACLYMNERSPFSTQLETVGCKVVVREPNNNLYECLVEGEATEVKAETPHEHVPQIILIGATPAARGDASPMRACRVGGEELGTLNGLFTSNREFGDRYPRRQEARLLRIPVQTAPDANGIDVWFIVRGDYSEKYVLQYLRFWLSRELNVAHPSVTANTLARSNPRENFEDGALVQIAGENLETTTRISLLNALKARAWSLESTECAFETGSVNGCLTNYYELEKSNDESGIKRVLIETFAESVITVEYNIDTMANYTAFVRALDARYGVSERSNQNGCIERAWDSKEIAISASYCRTKEEPFEIYFLNVENYAYQDVVELAEKVVRHWVAKPGSANIKTNRRIPADMF
jgi:hypothetical protein